MYKSTSFFIMALGCCLVFVEERHQKLIQGCAPAVHPGDWVDIRDESALIVWDPETKTEHFIRRARFETAAEDFGFLVPTPTQPDLGEADDQLFSTFGRMTAARHLYQTRTIRRFGFGSLLPMAKLANEGLTASALPPAAGPAVQVLDEKQVAGFDAAVLKADDADALSEWLRTHGYESRPALTEWLKWYVDNKWIITAFKLVKGQQNNFNSKSVRMSFQTDKPFYPYREPEDMRNPSGQGSRTLRVFFLSDRRYTGGLGDKKPWPANSVWADDISNSISGFATRLNFTSIGGDWPPGYLKYLTEFEDQSFPRPGTDEVYFEPSADQSSKERPPVIHTTEVIEYWPGPWGAVALTIGFISWMTFRIRRFLKARSSA